MKIIVKERTGLMLGDSYSPCSVRNRITILVPVREHAEREEEANSTATFPIVRNPLRASCTIAAEESQGSRGVVSPLKLNVKVPPYY